MDVTQMETVEVNEIDTLEPYIDAVVANNGDESHKLVLAADPDASDEGGDLSHLMLYVTMRVLQRVLGPVEGWELAHLTRDMWRSIVQLFRPTEWVPCVACAQSSLAVAVQPSRAVPGHWLWQSTDWDERFPMSHWDVHAMVIWMVPVHFSAQP